MMAHAVFYYFVFMQFIIPIFIFIPLLCTYIYPTIFLTSLQVLLFLNYLCTSNIGLCLKYFFIFSIEFINLPIWFFDHLDRDRAKEKITLVIQFWQSVWRGHYKFKVEIEKKTILLNSRLERAVGGWWRLWCQIADLFLFVKLLLTM